MLNQAAVLASLLVHKPANNYKNKQPQQGILDDLRLWLLISYNVTRSLEGYEAFALICADDETNL